MITEQLAHITPRMISWARACKFLTLSEAARKLDVSAEKLMAWEGGESHPTMNQARTIAKVFNISFGYLWLSSPPDVQLEMISNDCG